MSFFGKICKITSIALMAAGGTVAVASTIMLGVGTQATYTMEIGGAPQKFYIGSANFNKNVMEPGAKYSDLVAVAKAFLASFNSLPPESLSEDVLEQKKMFEKLLQANDLMIAGAVLFSLSSVTLIAGVVLFIINLRK